MIKDDLDLISLTDLKSELLQDSDTQHHYLELQARKNLVQDLKSMSLNRNYIE